MSRTHTRLLHLENQIHHRLILHSVAALRISVGVIFLAFGVLKFFPGVSPAENLAVATTHILFLGLVPGAIAIKVIATLECTIGLCLLTGRAMRLGIWLLAAEFVGILSPIILLPARLFAGPHGAPTLEGQYVLKDLILVAAGMVIAAGAFRGGRLIRADLPPTIHARADTAVDPEHRLQIVLEGIEAKGQLGALCASHHVTESQFYGWRERALSGATLALTDEPPAAL